MINSRFLDGMTIEQAKEEVAKRLEKETRAGQSSRLGAAPGQLPPARLGHFAPALLGLPDPDHPLRQVRRRPGAGKRSAGDAAGGRDLRQTGQSARPPSDLEARHVSQVRRRRRGARPTPWTPSSIRPGTSSASPIRGSRRRRPIRKWPTTGCRSTNISAASSTRFCICSIRASSPAPCTRPATSAWTSPSPACSRRAWWCTKPIAAKAATGSSRPTSRSTGLGDARRATLACDRRAGRDRLDREDVEVEEEHHRPRRHHRRLRRRHRALVHAVGFAARARRDLDRGRRAGRLALCAAAVAADRRDRRHQGASRAASRVCASRPSPCARPPTARSPTSPTTSPSCASTAASRTSTNAPTRSATPSARPKRRRAPDFAWALREAGDILVRLFHPMMPHLAEECWAALGHKTLVSAEAWPRARGRIAGGKHRHLAGAGQRQEARRSDG